MESKCQQHKGNFKAAQAMSNMGTAATKAGTIEPTKYPTKPQAVVQLVSVGVPQSKAAVRLHAARLYASMT
jgi:hypothetical protein